MLENKFIHTDEHGQITETRKTYLSETLEATHSIGLMASDFRTHLRNCGFAEETIEEYIHFKI